MPGKVNREIGLVFMEHDAMQAAFAAAEGQGDPAAARALVQQVFVSWRPTDFEGKLTLCAMAKFIGEDLSPFFPQRAVENPWERRCFETIGRAWAAWAMDPLNPEAAYEIRWLREEQVREAQEGGDHPKTAGAIHLMALDFWAMAVGTLAQGDPVEAKRLWKRAIEIGGTHGTPSHPAVLWTYAASFI